jgi:hypothetical protein
VNLRHGYARSLGSTARVMNCTSSLLRVCFTMNGCSPNWRHPRRSSSSQLAKVSITSAPWISTYLPACFASSGSFSR